MQAEEDISPISYVKTHFTDAINQVNDTQRPIYVTQNGKPTAVLLDVRSYESLLAAVSLMHLISSGVEDVKHKRYKEQSAFFKEFEKKHLLKNNA